jgi:GAF domain-containing protein
VVYDNNSGIAGSVATTGRTVNIPDAYNDERFNKAMDSRTGWRTRSILCMAIRNHKDETVGVLQVLSSCYRLSILLWC